MYQERKKIYQQEKRTILHSLKKSERKTCPCPEPSPPQQIKNDPPFNESIYYLRNKVVPLKGSHFSTLKIYLLDAKSVLTHTSDKISISFFKKGLNMKQQQNNKEWCYMKHLLLMLKVYLVCESLPIKYNRRDFKILLHERCFKILKLNNGSNF